MDIRQVEEQLALVLASAVFTDSPNQAILTSVAISRQDLGAFLAAWDSVAAKTCPFAVVRVQNGKTDADAATHASGSMGRGVRQFFRATVLVVAGSIVDPVPSPPPFLAVGNVTGDNVHGQYGLVGNVLAAGSAIGVRAGQGVDRIVAEVVRQALGNGELIDNVHGVQGRVVGTSDAIPVYGAQLFARKIDLEITNGSTQESYHAPVRFKAVVAGSTVTLTWSAVPTRPDFVSYVLLRDSVQIATPTNPTYTDAGVAPGAHVYSLVAGYDDAHRNPTTTVNRQSTPVLLNVTV